MNTMHFRPMRPALLGLLLVLGSATALAGAPPFEGSHHERFEAGHLPRHLEALGLSDAQKAKIKSLHQGRRETMKAQREQGRTLHESLRDLSPAAPNYTREVDRLATLIGQEHAARIRERAAMKAEVWTVLTPSQQAQLAAMPRPEPRKAHWRGKH